MEKLEYTMGLIFILYILLSKVSLGCGVERDKLNVRELWTHVMKQLVEGLEFDTINVDVVLVDLHEDEVANPPFMIKPIDGS